MLQTFATLAQPGTWHGQGGADALVGRLVANGELLRALFRHSQFERFLFFAGENADAKAVHEGFVASGFVEEKRIEVKNLLALPQSLAARELSLLHATSYNGAFLDLCWLRDRFAPQPSGAKAIPVTAQVHSLSYPRDLQTFLRARILPPSPCDAIICTSERGKSALLAGQRMIDEGISREMNLPRAALDCAFPVIPLGVESEEFSGGDGASIRRKHGIPEDAVVALSIGRFSEYDKQDLFPLLGAFREALAIHSREISPTNSVDINLRKPLYLLLAGARQGTQTPEMVLLWAKALGIADRVKLEIDFPSAKKRDLLAAADLFIAVSDNPQETFGLSVIEAMAAGKPVVVSDYNGYRDTVPDSPGTAAGIRIPTTAADDLSFLHDLSPILYERPLHLFVGQSVAVDAKKLTAAIVELARDESLRTALGAAARDLVKSRFDWKSIVRQLEAMWLLQMQKPNRALQKDARHPLGLDFQRMFSGYPTGVLAPEALLQSTPFGREMCGAELKHPIYPEEKNIVRASDVLLVHRVLSEAPHGLRARELQAALQAFLGPKEAWRAGPAIAWMLKHAIAAAS